MRKNLMPTCIVFGTIVAAATAARATIIADFTDDFSYPNPAPGWSYLWNANGPIGTAGNYVSLVADASALGRYETEDNTPDSFPDAAPGSSASATSTSLIPGQGAAQNPFERYVLAAYTISAEDIATHGNLLSIDLYSFAVSADSQDGVTARIYRNDLLYGDFDLPPGTVFDYQTSAPGGGRIDLGPFVAGDTLYIAIGADGIAPLPGGGNDVNDVLTVDYSIVPTPIPEPSLGALIGLVLIRRRRR